MANITGTSGNDTLNGTTGVDTILGLDGNDLIYALGGADWVEGGNGQDTINGGGGNDTLFGDAGNDELNGGSGDDSVNGGAGHDHFIEGTSTGSDTYNGGDTSSIDWVDYSASSTGGGFDAVNGTMGLNGHTDTLINIEKVSGSGTTNDFIDFTGNSEGVNYSFLTGEVTNADSGILEADGFESFKGSSHDDHVAGSSADEIIKTFDGNDTIINTVGNDTYDTGAGDDIIYLGNYNSTAFITDTSGSDQLSLQSTGYNFVYDAVNGTVDVGDAIDGFNEIASWNTLNTFFEDIYGGDNNDTLIGSIVADTLRGGSGADSIEGGGGNDVLYSATDSSGLGDTGFDTLVGGNGNDAFYNDLGSLQAGGDLFIDASGNDTYNFIGSGLDTIQDTSGSADVLNILSRPSTDMYALDTDSDGNLDQLVINFDVDGLTPSVVYHIDDYFADNASTITASNAGVGLIESINFSNASYNFAGIKNIVGIGGTSSSDNIAGTNGADTIYGLNGDDTITGYAGNDVINGNNGDDTFIEAVSTGSDTYNGGAGSDTVDYSSSSYSGELNLSSGLMGLNGFYDSLNSVEHVIGSSAGATDGISNNGDASNVNINLSTGTATGGDYGNITFANFEKAIGGSGDDTLTGTTGNDNLQGRDGNDEINGGAGNDYTYGGNGDDLYVYNDGFGNDIMQDTSGNDTLDFGALSASEDIDLLTYYAGGAVEITAGSSQININANTFIENVIGGAGDDYFEGYVEANNFAGGAGNDTLYSHGGADTLDGGAGNDLLRGHSGDDSYINISGSFGVDIINDHSGTDSATFTGYDTTDATWSASGDDLEINFSTGAILTIEDYFDGATTVAGAGEIESLVFDDTTFDFSDVSAIV